MEIALCGTPIYVVKLGKGQKEVFYSASIHANEFITTSILMKFIEDYCISYKNNTLLYGYPIRKLFNLCSIYLMPMVNPDGVDLVTGTLTRNSFPYKCAQKIAYGFASISFPNGWKANIRGVDF